MPVDAPQLLAFTTDLTNDPTWTARMRAALADPPMTTEAVGFYGAADNPPAENCYRLLVSGLANEGRLFAAEDKVVHELFVQLDEAFGVPDGLKALFPAVFDPTWDWEALGSDPGAHHAEETRVHAGWEAAVDGLEAKLVSDGRRLMLLDTGQGDTLHHVLVDEALAARWGWVPLVHTAAGQPLGLRPLDRAALYDHVAYASGFRRLSAPVPDVPRWR